MKYFQRANQDPRENMCYTKDWAVQQTFNCHGIVGQLFFLGFVANSGTAKHWIIGDQLTTLKNTRCHINLLNIHNYAHDVFTKGQVLL